MTNAIVTIKTPLCLYSEPLEEECIGGEKKTGAIWNKNTLQFSDNIGGTANPLFFPYNDSSLVRLPPLSLALIDRIVFHTHFLPSLPSLPS